MAERTRRILVCAIGFVEWNYVRAIDESVGQNDGIPGARQLQGTVKVVFKNTFQETQRRREAQLGPSFFAWRQLELIPFCSS
jgi:hypothetical protein